MTEADPSPFPEIKLFHPIKTALELGTKALQLLGLRDYPTDVQQTLPFDSEGNWHNPDGL